MNLPSPLVIHKEMNWLREAFQKNKLQNFWKMSNILQKIVNWLSTDFQLIVNWLSTDCNQLSTNCQPIAKQLSSNWQPIVNQLSTDCQSAVNQLSKISNFSKNRKISKNFWPSNPNITLQILQILEANL